MSNNIKLITCDALTHLFEPMIGPDVTLVVLPISLHLKPEKLREHLIEEIRKIEEAGWNIVLGYGLCGRALEGVYSLKSRLIVPRVDDCIGVILGSRKRHKRILDEDAGCFFLEPSWIGTEVDIFAQCFKGLDKIPEEYRSEIVWMAIKNYSKLALLHHGKGTDSPATLDCKALAEQYNLSFMQYLSDLTLLERLVSGPWNKEEFVVAEPGEKIPFF